MFFAAPWVAQRGVARPTTRSVPWQPAANGLRRPPRPPAGGRHRRREAERRADQRAHLCGRGGGDDLCAGAALQVRGECGTRGAAGAGRFQEQGRREGGEPAPPSPPPSRPGAEHSGQHHSLPLPLPAQPPPHPRPAPLCPAVHQGHLCLHGLCRLQHILRGVWARLPAESRAAGRSAAGAGEEACLRSAAGLTASNFLCVGSRKERGEAQEGRGQRHPPLPAARLQLAGIIAIKLLQKASVHLDLVSFCYMLFNFAVSALTWCRRLRFRVVAGSASRGLPHACPLRAAAPAGGGRAESPTLPAACPTYTTLYPECAMTCGALHPAYAHCCNLPRPPRRWWARSASSSRPRRCS